MPKEDKFDYWQCPKCGYDTTSYSPNPIDDDPPVEYSQVYTDYEGVQSWTEYWTCPDCETKFEVENGT